MKKKVRVWQGAVGLAVLMAWVAVMAACGGGGAGVAEEEPVEAEARFARWEQMGSVHVQHDLDVDGNTTFAGTVDVDGDVTFDDMAISGTLDVDGATTLDGGLAMDTDAFTVADTSGNTGIAGTLDVDGATTVDGFTASELANLDAGIAVDTNAFTVADVSGNTGIAGTLDVDGVTNLDVVDIDDAVDMASTLDVDGNTTLTGTLDVDGATTVDGFTASELANLDAGIAVDTNAFTVADTSGNTVISGTLDVAGATTLDGGLAMDTDAFTVADGTGNTVIAGTLDAQGNVSDSGGALTIVDNVIVDGAADAQQLVVQGHSTQSSNAELFVVENSSASDLFWVTNTGDAELNGTSPTLTIGDAGEEDSGVVFDGAAQDFYAGIYDTDDDLQIGLGSALGTTPIIVLDENQEMGIGGASAGAKLDVTGNVMIDGGADEQQLVVQGHST